MSIPLTTKSTYRQPFVEAVAPDAIAARGRQKL